MTLPRVHVAGNVYEKLSDPLGPWVDSFLPQRIRSTLQLNDVRTLLRLCTPVIERSTQRSTEIALPVVYMAITSTYITFH